MEFARAVHHIREICKRIVVLHIIAVISARVAHVGQVFSPGHKSD